MRLLLSSHPIGRRAALVLILLAAASGAARPAQAQTATFNFSADAVGTGTTFSDVNNGDTATFSSPADPGGFTVFPSLFKTLTGNVLIDNVLNANVQIPLMIAFSQPSRSFSLNFAQNINVASPLDVSFFNNGVLVGGATAFGAPVGPNNSEGVLSYSSGSLFNAVTLTSPNSTAFAVDNIHVDVLPVPEASTTVSFGLLLALGMGGLVIAARRKRASSAL